MNRNDDRPSRVRGILAALLAALLLAGCPNSKAPTPKAAAGPATVATA